MSIPPRLTIAFDVPEPLRSRATWAFEHLVSVADVRWKPVAPGHGPDIGYGCAGRLLSLPAETDAWDISRAAPHVRWDDYGDAPEGDLLAATFWHLARVEEFAAVEVADITAFDEHDRFRSSASSAPHLIAEHTNAQSGIASMPTVDVYADRLQGALGLEDLAWPEAYSSALALTHDIDLPWRWSPVGRRRVMRASREHLKAMHLTDAIGSIGSLATIPFWRLRRSDPYLNARAICELERMHDTRSTNYVIAGHHAPEDGDAAVYLRVIGDYARDVLSGGGSLGLHGSYTSSVTAGRIAQELADLENLAGVRIVDHRFHYLRHQPVRDWPMLAEAGIHSDASLGWAEHAGWRAATSRPFRAWDHGNNRALNLIIVPLAFMDASLEARYLNLSASSDGAKAIVDEVVDTVVASRGAASVLWHNDKLQAPGARNFTRLYERMLRHASDQGVWLTDAGSISATWRARLHAARG